MTPLLRVLGRRTDGYHDVRVALVPISLFDQLQFARAEGFRLLVEGGEALGPIEENLVARAVRMFEADTLRPVRYEIRLTKRIPAGAGLGGGSGNAAGTLLTLNELHGRPLPPPRLRQIAGALGSDVPFFLDPRPAWATGRGDVLAPMAAFPALRLLIVKPPLSIATAQAYRWVRPLGADAGAAPLATLAQVLAALENTFETALFPRFPELAAVRARLLAEGAAGALLSGSGSALFGVFAEEAARDRAAERLRAAEPDWQVLACDTLHAHRYAPEPAA
ncbi:MAG: 4-(cytidine 5'-diphospho)-2-C-methyl-D-erythritol kinase [Candidatus Lambdaproteobacteria bacterium]|nr:4-(cytidine 5'-diphospho)-2-C-methyl-D-erythritol kinase [Candidatus Lambdaproteobacteria bacterium]